MDSRNQTETGLQAITIKMGDNDLVQNNTKVPEKGAVSAKDISNIKRKEPVLYEKLFKTRESLLTDLLQDKHLATIYNICWISLIYWAAQSMFYDYFNDGRIYLGVKTLKTGFNGIHFAFACWFLVHVGAFLVFYGFKLWTLTYSNINYSILSFLLNLPWLIVYVASLPLLLYMSIKCCLTFDLPIGSATALIMETIRLLMKMHAFVRTSAPQWINAVRASANSELSAYELPSFTFYFYFLFAPTLIFRNSYPLTQAPIRWRFVLLRLLETIAGIVLICFMHERYIRPYFSEFGATRFSVSQIVNSFFGMIVPSTIILVTIFYQVLHAVQNFFAELLHFGDRAFYKSWWTATNYRGYFCEWNCLVQDWLYEYIYKDVAKHISTSRRFIAFVIFTASALMHEIILGVSLQMFFPVNYILFGVLNFVLIRVKLPGRLGNLFLLFTLILGNTIVIFSYSVEYYAKQNCPKTRVESITDYAMPHILNCYRKYE